MYTWHYMDNQFEVATRGSYKLCYQISITHEAALSVAAGKNAILVPIHTRYKTVHDIFKHSYEVWDAEHGIRSGKTLTVKQQLALASKRLIDWEYKIIPTFKPETSEYKTIFPNGRADFNRGSIDTRIAAYSALAIRMKDYEPLATILTEVTQTYNDLIGYRGAQKGVIKNLDNESSNVEQARISAMNMMYRNLGFCMDNFCDNKTFIESLFDLEGIRRHQQTHFTHHLKAGKSMDVCMHTFLPNDTFMLTLEGLSDVELYLGTAVKHTDSNPIAASAASITQIKIADFDIALDQLGLHRYLTIVNKGITDIQYTIDFQ